MKKILGIGNALVDTLVSIGSDSILRDFSLPVGGMTLIDEDTYCHLVQHLFEFPVKRRTGGSASNVMRCIAARGGKSSFIGRLGDDANGEFYIRESKLLGVDLHQIVDNDLPTGVATTFVLPDGERTFATYLGAASRLCAKQLEPVWVNDAQYVFIEGYLVQDHDLINTIISLAKRQQAKVCLDLASWNIVEAERTFFEQLLSHIDIVFANEDEARAITEAVGETAARVLARNSGIAVVKCGSKGAVAVEGDRVVYVPACPTDHVLDTTGAGDFFAGGFLYSHALGRPLKTCLEDGARCAAEVICVMGTHLSQQTWMRLCSYDKIE